MELRKHLPTGFVAFNGRKWAGCQVESYNALQDRMNSFIKGGVPIPEYLVNGSHNLFCSYSKTPCL